MSYINDISDDVLNQIIPEEMPSHFKKFVIYHASGFSIAMIANITQYKPNTINRALHTAKEIIIVNTLNDLRLVIAVRLTCYTLRDKK